MPIDYDEVLREGFGEFRQFINPLIAQRASMAGEPIAVVGSRDGLLIDNRGNAFEDFHGTQTFGHRHPAITAAVRAYLDSDVPTWFPSRVSPLAGRLARRLSERTGYDNAFFGFSGADAVEAAIKLSRAWSKRPRILGIEGAYHGCTMGACALMTPGVFRDPFGPHLPGVEHLPFGDIEALKRALKQGDVAGVVVEPIQGEGGVRTLPDDYVVALCALTTRHDVLLVADEVQTGLGRTGRGFLYTADWPRRPDVVLLAKALGGGLIPLSAMLTRRDVFMRAYGAHFASGESHNMTFSFNSTGAAAGLATLELVTDAVIARVRRIGGSFKQQLIEAIGDHPLVEEVRGEGLMLGVKLRRLDHPWLSFEHFGLPELSDHPVISPLLCHRLYKRGFFCFTCGHDWSLFRLQPRLNVPEETLTRFVGVCREELDYLWELV